MNSHYRQTLDKVEEILAEILPPEADSSWGDRVADCKAPAVRPEAYRRINAPALDLLGRGGKRWRPVLMSLCCELCGGGKAALPLTPLVELPHNGSLIIDDIEDSSDTRRGGPAIHLKFGEEMAINTGNLLYFLPLCLIDEADLPTETKLLLYTLHGKSLRRLHLGQGLDIQWHLNLDLFPPKEAYLRMCRHKTGSLAWLAGQAGAAVAAAPEADRDRLGTLLEDMGVAFQILDDVKNLTLGNPGKKRGDDIVEGKKSLPVILFGQRRPEKRRQLTDYFREAGEEGINRGQKAVGGAIALMEEAGAIQEARIEGETMLRQVEMNLRKFYPPSPARRSIEELLTSFWS